MLSVACLLFLVAACRAQQTDYRPIATVKDIMDSMVEPSADVLWDSVARIDTFAGTEKKAPHTDEEWADVRRHAIELIEATNLLVMPGRHVAQPGEKADQTEILLPPEQIEALVNQDRVAWSNLAHGLNDAGAVALKAINAKDAQGLLDAGEGIDTACENCHLKYWYPDSKEGPAK